MPTMSGLEVVGVIYGSIHFLLSAMNGYVNFLLAERRHGAGQELMFIRDLLTREGAGMFQVCSMLLRAIVPEQNIETILQDPMGSLWQSK